MLSTAVIIFRETLEIVLILGVILAATRTVRGRGLWIGLGLGGGLAGAALVAVFAEAIADALSGTGQEVFNAAIMFTAAGFIGWTALWVKSSARAAVARFQETGAAVAAGTAHGSILALVIGLAILREGAEIALFLSSLHLGGQSVGSIAGGALAGTAAGILAGILFYCGILKLQTRWALTVTSWLLILLVAGLTAQGVGYLAAAGLITSAQAWNTTWLLSEESLLGKVLHGLIGYTSRPVVAQVVAYVVTAGFLAGGLAWIGRRARTTGRPAMAVAATGLLALVASTPTHAADSIDTPYVVDGELALEYAGSRTFDPLPERNGVIEHAVAVEYGFTGHILGEVSAHYAKEPEGPTILEKIELETRIQLFEPGQLPVDIGFLAAYGIATMDEAPDSVEGKLLLGLDTGRFSQLASFGAEKDVGRYAEPEDPEYAVQWSGRYRWLPEFQPGIEYQAELEHEIDHFHDQAHAVGPASRGKFGRHLVYQAAWLFGVSDAAPEQTARLTVEYELNL